MKFIETGIRLQRDAVSKADAGKRLAASCNICSMHGFNISCDSCPIKAAYELTISAFADIEEFNMCKAEEKAKKNFAIDCAEDINTQLSIIRFLLKFNRMTMEQASPLLEQLATQWLILNGATKE